MTVPGFPTARDPMLSLLQSAAAVVGRRRGQAAGAPDGPHPLVRAADRLIAARHDGAGTAAAGSADQAASSCVGLGLELLEAVATGHWLRAAALRARLAFSACDPLWAETLVDYARGLRLDGAPRPVPYVRYQAPGDFVVTAPSERMRIALVSDWGTGTDVARAVAALMAAQRPDVVIHLGDIYFAATVEECALHFLQPLRAVLPARLFTLCGNHDVYGGGQGYYGLLREIGQPASYFCLRSPDRSWQILAADTGLHDRDPFDVATAVTFLDPLEELWHADKLRGHGGLSLFLTHHPPFSAYAQIGRTALHDPTNPALMASHARLAQAGPIDAWFWGHEHVLRLYAPYRGVAAGRTIGYGAIPVAAPVAPLAGLVDPPALAVDLSLDVAEGASTHGFALLECGPDGIDASYWALTRPDGPIHRERFGADRSS